MEWPRIKTIVLAILLITNIGLLSFVVQRAYQGRQMQREARENAILFLQNSGIEVDPAVIPERMGLPPQTVKRDREQEARIASALLGGAVQELSWGAEAFRYYNEKGYLQFHRDGALKGEFVEGELPIQDPDSMDYSQQILRLLEFEGDVVASTGTAGEEPMTTVVVQQSWKGAPLFRQELTLSYKNGCLVQVEGRRLNGEPELDPSREPISIPTALFQFYHGVTALGDVCSRIDSITEGYLNPLPNGAGPSDLVPVWSISTDTGAYLLNTLTGELSRSFRSERQEKMETFTKRGYLFRRRHVMMNIESGAVLPGKKDRTMITKESPIGVIDSGIGGFSVARKVQKLMPHENLLYLGDGANTPYGNHSAEEILTMTRYMLRFMEDHGVKALLVACNTISCLIDQYRDEMSCPVLSVVQAGADAVAQLPAHKVGVISTCFTASTHCYPDLIGKVAPDKQVISHGCPNLANLVERNVGNPAGQAAIDDDLRENLEQLVNEEKVECCVLGCTHYPLVEENINRLYPQLKLVDPAEQMARTVGRYLEEKGLVNDQPGQGKLDIFTTGSTEEYTMKAAKVGLDPVTSVQFYPPMKL